jgi:mono/diheme cytochrome c family protein
VIRVGRASRRLRVAAAVVLVSALVLAACSPSARSPPKTARERGADLYEGNCIGCHQENGAGIPGLYPSLSGSPVVSGDVGALARWVIRGERPASMPRGRYGGVMPQFAWLKDADAAALFTYLRSNFGNNAPAADAAAVAAGLAQP